MDGYDRWCSNAEGARGHNQVEAAGSGRTISCSSAFKSDVVVFDLDAYSSEGTWLEILIACCSRLGICWCIYSATTMGNFFQTNFRGMFLLSYMYRLRYCHMIVKVVNKMNCKSRIYRTLSQ